MKVNVNSLKFGFGVFLVNKLAEKQNVKTANPLSVFQKNMSVSSEKKKITAIRRIGRWKT